MHNKEVTIEISTTKFPASSELPNYWNYNKQAFLDYIKQANYGLQGKVTDASGNPISAKVYISNYDLKGAWVKTGTLHGDYYKLLIAGSYNVIFEAPGSSGLNWLASKRSILDVVLSCAERLGQ